MPRQNTAQKVAAKALYGKNYYAKQAPVIETSLKFTNVFLRNFECQKRFILNRGGAGSSKSHSIAQLFTYKFLNEKKKSILILRKSLPYLKISTLPLIYKVWDEMKVRDRFREEKLLLNYYYKDNWMHFGSIDDSEKLKCFHPDTELFTNMGWKNIKDIKKGEYVGTLNPQTKKGEFRAVTKTFCYDTQGKW